MREARLLHGADQKPPVRGLLQRWRSDISGATAVEFAIISVPFIMFIFGIIGIGLHFFTTSTLEAAVETASRKVLTGQAQSGGLTLGEFKQLITKQGPGVLKPNQLNLHIQKASSWTALTPVQCLNGSGGLTPPTGNANDKVDRFSGGAGEVVLITACYEWDIARVLGPVSFGNMANGSTLIRAAATFKTEPYQ